MPEVIRVARSSYSGRDRDDHSSDDDRSSHYSRAHRGHGDSEGTYRTVQRYRVTPGRVEDVREDRRVTEYRSSQVDLSSPRDSGRIEIDRRVERYADIPERPRSTVVERTYERDEREPIRDSERERTRTVVYERERDRPRESLRPWEREPERPWDRFSDKGRETDVRIEKRVERTERREEPYELERYQKETEYYDRPEPTPAPIIIRQRAPEPQQIIVQEAPAPPPIIVPREPEPTVQVIQRREEVVEEPRPEPRREDEYYYRRDVVERGPRREQEYAVTRYDRRDVRPRDSVSDYSDDEEYVSRKVVRRRASSSPHRKRHLAEGALAGAGAAALLASHREKQGEGPVHRGRQVVGGAALGAIGAEVLTRARSRYRESHYDRSRSRSSSHGHHKVKTALGLAVAGLAAAAAVKYAQNRKADREEIGRGRSRTRSVSRRRYSASEYTRSKSRHDDPKHRAAQMAKAGAATAAVAGVVEHFRNKSRKRSGSRSKSRIRTGAEIAASGLAGAAVAGLYENRKAKEEREEELIQEKRERRRSRSRATSVGAYSDPGVDPELGMVEYGGTPVYTQQTTTYREHYDPAIAAGAGAAYGASRHHHRSRSRRSRRGDSYSSSSDDGRRRHRSRSRSRSQSRVRDIAGAALGTGAAAIGIHQYKKRKEKKEADRERERERERRREVPQQHSRSRYEEEAEPDNYYAQNYRDDGYSPSPPHASGGAYYTEHVNTSFAPPPTQPATFTQHTTTTHVNDGPIPPYNPADYAGQPAADSYGYPPHPNDHVSSAPPMNGYSQNQTPYFPPPPTMSGGNQEPRFVDRHDEDRVRNGLISPSTVSLNSIPTTPMSERPHNRSVTFAPLSPTSSRSLAKVHAKAPESAEPEVSTSDTDISPERSEHHRHHHRRRRRRSSDPSSNRPHTPSKHRRRHRNASRSPSPDRSSDDTEVLPDRFDRDGRPLHDRGFGGSSGGGNEMVERLVIGFGDVIEGRSSWKDLLRGVLDEDGSGGGSASPHGLRRRR
ncbi:hypothetical protein BP5796_02260 [Coleophoma crateriformis]|uniref:DUF3824 domain-containing protein n=1 Tax=Coleophoma crateriformis TaxID=565419 RepID=A0A3D8SXQ8_9HELO|nr:hypothetical protein BP5796_02260 [Coleophoma crateriformis]